VYYAPSVAAAGIAAHEAGHALQDAEDYFPMEARSYIVPVVQLASQAAPWLFVTGLMLQLDTLTWAGVILFGSSFLLAFLTLPVEFNASARATELLVSHGIIQGDEQIVGVEKVLGLQPGPTWRQRYPPSVCGCSTPSSYCFADAQRQASDKPSSPLAEDDAIRHSATGYPLSWP
jgi:hypothetical protein